MQNPLSISISSGIFKGLTIPEAEITNYPDDQGNSTPWWPALHRTAHFIERFSPIDGYSIVIKHRVSNFQLPDYRSKTDSGEVLYQPTVYFEAILKKDGKIIATANSLEVINAPKAFERGETNVRGRLYESLGLPGNLRHLFPLLDPTPKADPSISAVIPVLKGNARSSSKHSSPSNATPQDEPSLHLIAPADKDVESSEVSENESQSQVVATEESASNAPAQVIQVHSSRKKNASITRGLLQAAETLCLNKGIEVPEFESDASVKEFLKSTYREQQTKAVGATQ